MPSDCACSFVVGSHRSKQHGDTGPAAACGHGPATRLPNQLFVVVLSVGVDVRLRAIQFMLDGMW